MRSRRNVCLVLLFTAPGLCQETAKSLHVVRASGEATITAKPDRVEIFIGVVTQAATAQQAANANAAKTTQMMDAVKRALASAGEVKTSDYSISPDYEYPKNEAPKIAGYHASNTVLVTIDDLSLAGKMIDIATSSGANNIPRISFTLRNDEPIRAQALAEAAAKARANAEAIAKALNLEIIGIVEAQSTGTPRIQPVMFQAAEARAAVAATPIEAGTLDIHASVTVSLEVR